MLIEVLVGEDDVSEACARGGSEKKGKRADFFCLLRGASWCCLYMEREDVCRERGDADGVADGSGGREQFGQFRKQQ